MNLAELDVRILFGILGLVKSIGFNYIFGFKKGRQDKRLRSDGLGCFGRSMTYGAAMTDPSRLQRCDEF